MISNDFTIFLLQSLYSFERTPKSFYSPNFMKSQFKLIFRYTSHNFYCTEELIAKNNLSMSIMWKQTLLNVFQKW